MFVEFGMAVRVVPCLGVFFKVQDLLGDVIYGPKYLPTLF